MPKNKLLDLNNHLFEELERLNDEELKEEELEKEIARANAITDVAQTIINNGELILKAQKHYDEYGIDYDKKNLMLGLGSGNSEKS